MLPSPRIRPLRFWSKGWQRSGLIAPRRTKPQYSSFSMISTAPGDRHVGAPGADLIGGEADRVVPGGAGGGEGLHHPARAERAGDVDRQERASRSGAASPGRPSGPSWIQAPVELAEDVGLAHRRADDHRRALARERVVGFSPASSAAIRAAATVKAEQRPIRPASASVMKSVAEKPFTSPPRFRGRFEVSKSETSLMPDRPSTRAFQYGSRPRPSEDTTPMPVT